MNSHSPIGTENDSETETAAVVSISAFVIIGEEHTGHGIEPFPATEDPDEHADAILGAIHAEPETLKFRLTGGDDHGDGLTSYDYLAPATLAELSAFMDWVGEEPGSGTPNMGLLTGPEEYGYIPEGMTFSADGMDWNIGGITRFAGVDFAVFPLTENAARATFGGE